MMGEQITGLASIPPGLAPRLVISVDTEEQWQSPPSRDGVRVAPAETLTAFQDIMDKYAVRPLYVVDYPIVEDDAYSDALSRIRDDGRCQIGTHSHTHLTPPLEETVTPANTFMGNLPRELEYRKLVTMTDRIESRFGLRPTIYRAGRYGIGPNTAGILEELGYQIDCSVVPHTNFRTESGPDFRGLPDRPYWFGQTRSLLEVPLTVGFAGLIRSLGATTYDSLTTRRAKQFRIPGVLNRLKLLTRIRLTPEGVPLDEMKWLTRTLLRDGHRVFCMSLHSCSLEPGGSPYVQSKDQLDHFLLKIDRYCAFFRDVLGGQPATYEDIADICQPPADHGPMPAKSA